MEASAKAKYIRTTKVGASIILECGGINLFEVNRWTDEDVIDSLVKMKSELTYFFDSALPQCCLEYYTNNKNKANVYQRSALRHS